MELITKIQVFIEQLEEQHFYYYIGGFLGAMLLLNGGLMYYHYETTSTLTRKIRDLNDEREESIRTLLSKALRVAKEQSEINAMLAESEDFKIGGYFEGVRNQLGLTPSLEATAQADREDNYRESSLKAKFDEILYLHTLPLVISVIQNNYKTILC